jgi:VIT1/CCC1 family predicted Fe2+/Mn2+ transporter
MAIPGMPPRARLAGSLGIASRLAKSALEIPPGFSKVAAVSHHSDHQADHTPEAIRARLREGARQAYLKDSVFGAIDGTVTTFAVVSSIAGAGLPSGLVVILGVANLLADGFSMASGNFLGTRAENQASRRTRREEAFEIEHYPEGEREEIRQIFAAKGFSGDTLEQVVRVITADRARWIDVMLQEEHGIHHTQPVASKAAIATFLAFLLIGTIPLVAYLVDLAAPGKIEDPFAVAALMTGVAFALVGAVKAHVVGQPKWLGAIETLAVGALASGLAYGIGYLLRPFAEF